MREVCAAAHAASKSAEGSARERYRTAVECTGYWAFLDLKSSAAFRQEVGDEAGYVRSEAFMATVRIVLERYQSVVAFKELGDGILIKSENFRPLFESGCVLDAVRNYWNVETAASPQQPSFDYRYAITKGTCTQIERPGGFDYLGAPLDLAARLCGHSIQDERGIAVLTSAVRQDAQVRITREYPFAAFGPDRQLDRKLTKPGESATWLSELLIDRGAFLAFKDFFEPIRSHLLSDTQSSKKQ